MKDNTHCVFANRYIATSNPHHHCNQSFPQLFRTVNVLGPWDCGEPAPDIGVDPADGVQSIVVHSLWTRFQALADVDPAAT